MLTLHKHILPFGYAEQYKVTPKKRTVLEIKYFHENLNI